MSTLTNPFAGPRSPIHAIARFTNGAFGLVPISLTMLILRITLAIPFWKSGMTKWDDWFTLSFGALASFDDFRLHILGAEYPYPAPELMAYASAVCEVTFPVFLVLGFLTRYAALGLLGMTAIIQLTVPDGWQTFHLPWASMALAILTFGPGRIALDFVLHLDRVSRPR